MSRHHPYGGMYDGGGRRGNSPSGPGPDRSHSRFAYDKGSGNIRGKARGRGDFNPGRNYGSGDAYGQNTDYSSTPNSYSQWNNSQEDSYYGQNNTSYGGNYGTDNGGYTSYDAGGYNDQNYGSYEDSSRGRGGKRGGAPPRRDREEKVHNNLIEERILRERPCRTLFIRNIKYETNSADVRRQFEEHGEIKTFFDLIANRGMVFVTYFDLRAAERARERLQDTEISGRPIDVHYSLPRPDDQNNKDPKDRNQGTLLVTLVNSVSGNMIDDNEVRRRFSAFGDVKNVKSAENIHTQRYVEYFDTRSCEDAHDRLQSQPLQDGTMDIEYSSDIPDVPLPPGPIPSRRPDERPTSYNPNLRDFEDNRGRRGNRSSRGGRGGDGSGTHRDEWLDRRGSGNNDDWDRNDRRGYRDDYDEGNRGRGGRGRGRGRGRGGYGGGGDRYDGRNNDYGTPPSSAHHPTPPVPQVIGYNQPNVPPPATGNVGERLDQARQVQALLEALKNPAANAPPAVPPTPVASAPPPPMQSSVPPFYPMPGMAPPPMYPGSAPPPFATGPPPPVPQQASSSAPSSVGIPGLPPNIYAMLQQGTAAGGANPTPPPNGALGSIPGMPPGMANGYSMPPQGQPPSGVPPANGGATQDYSQLLSFLQQNGKR